VPRSSEQSKITIVLLSYKRPQNIPIILDAINAQTVRATIFLWNNGTVDVNSPLIDHYEQSETYVGCMARWQLAKEASTPYVMSLDDDICFNRNDALEKVIRSLDGQDNPKRIVGFIGACFSNTLKYNVRKEHMCRYGDTNGRTVGLCDTCEMKNNGELVFVKRAFIDRDQPVDVVKGRAMAFRTKNVVDIDLPDEREDDIFLNAAFADGTRKFHRIPTLLNDVFRELPEYGEGNWIKQGHMTSRDRALKTYFSPAHAPGG
jgi:hypothetical protein